MGEVGVVTSVNDLNKFMERKDKSQSSQVLASSPSTSGWFEAIRSANEAEV